MKTQRIEIPEGASFKYHVIDGKRVIEVWEETKPEREDGYYKVKFKNTVPTEIGYYRKSTNDFMFHFFEDPVSPDSLNIISKIDLK